MTEAAQNTDSELWREVPGDYYSASIHVTKQGAIGINVGGTVHVMPVRDWHKLATLRAALAPGADDEPPKRYLDKDEQAIMNAALIASSTVVKRLSQPADGEVEAIRRRHGSDHLHLRYDSREYRELYEKAHTDRATLLAHVDRLSAELAAERAAVNALPELLALRKENERLKEALKPFVRDERSFLRQADDKFYKMHVKIGAIRRARAALSQEAGS